MPVKNIGLSERKIRFLFGILLILTSLLFLISNYVDVSIAFLGFSLIPLFTSITGTCPFYCAMRRSTNNQQIEKLLVEH